MADARGWSDILKKDQFPSFLDGTARQWVRYLKSRREPTFVGTPNDGVVVNANWDELSWAILRQLFLDHYSLGYDRKSATRAGF